MVFSRLVYHRLKLPTSRPARAQDVIDFSPSKLRDSATAMGLHGGAALVITHSRRSSNPRWPNTWLMLIEKTIRFGVANQLT